MAKQAKHTPLPPAWPRRVNPDTGRHEIQVDGVWGSRQRAWQKARILEGRCARCGEPRHLYAIVCDLCHDRMARRRHGKTGSHSWVPGGAGRPPIKALLENPPRDKDGT